MNLFLYKCANAHDLPNCNKLDMARNFIASSVSDLEAVGRTVQLYYGLNELVRPTVRCTQIMKSSFPSNKEMVICPIMLCL